MLKQSHIRFLVIAGVLALGLYVSRDSRLSRPAPAFSLPEVYGGQVNLSSYRGRPVLLVFWTTSCPICQRELPLLSQLAPNFRSKGVSVLAIHLGGESEAADYLSSNRINLSAAYDADGAVSRAYGVDGVPKLVLIDPEGKVKRSNSGWTGESVLRDWIE